MATLTYIYIYIYIYICKFEDIMDISMVFGIDLLQSKTLEHLSFRYPLLTRDHHQNGIITEVWALM